MSDRPFLPLNILVVDDEINIRKTLSVFLETEGHRVVGVSNFQDAVSETSSSSFDLAFVDIRLGTSSGLDLIPILLASAPWLKIIVITAYASIDTAIEAIRRGAKDYIPKPFTPAQIKLAVTKIAELHALEQQVNLLQSELGRINPEIDFTTSNPAMRHELSVARQVAQSNAIILLTGESGTGKTILGRMIHAWSHRCGRPFAVVSCPALSADLIESELFGHVKGAFTGAIQNSFGRISACEGGTLLLDEIGDLPVAVQPKLLRFIQEREYERVGDHITRKADVRLLAATNIDLEKAVAAGRFREDLYYRLNVIQIKIPPLRERVEDIAPFAQHLLSFFSKSTHRPPQHFTAEAVFLLQQYSWPGNIRELRNVVERASILCRSDEVGTAYLPEKLATEKAEVQPGDLLSLEKMEETHIRRTLANTKSLQEAADVLGIDQATLWRRRKKYQI